MYQRMSFSLIVVFFLMISPAVHAAASISSIEGRVLVNGQPASPGDTIQEGDQFRSTGSDSPHLDVVLEGNHQIRFKNARGSIEQLRSEISIELEQGTAYTAYDTTAAERSYRIRTPNGIAGIRGTKFFLRATPEQMYVCVCEGVVHVRKSGFWAGFFGERRSVRPGEDIHVYGDRPLLEPKASPRMFKRTWETFVDMGFEPPGDLDGK